jgi:ATP-dependent Lon protease
MQHLIPKQIANHGLPEHGVVFEDAAITRVIKGYTREAGLRNLGRELANLLRRTAKQIADFAAKHRLPAISMFRRFPEAGGLMSYGPNQPEYYKRLAFYIDKILKGAKPGDLPIEQPTKFEFVINLKTAKSLGLALTQSFVSGADQVIQ